MPNSIILNEGQQQALKIAVARYRERKPYTVIAGYAGSGQANPQ